jgi:hypothetical protein
MRTVIIISALLLSLASFSQKFYLATGIGGGLPTSGNLFITQSTTYNITTDTITSYSNLNSHKLKLGKGLIPQFAIGYKVNNRLSIELESMYLLGKPSTIKANDRYNIVYGMNSNSTAIHDFSANSLLILPTVTARTDNAELNYFLKAGFGFGSTSIDLNFKNRIYNGTSGFGNPFTNTEEVWKFYGGLSYALTIGSGIDYLLSENSRIFVQASYISCFTTPKYSSLQSFILDGEDKLDDLNTSQKEIVYSDFVDGNLPQDDDLPTQKIQRKYQLDMLRLSVGLVFYFGA